MLPPDTIDCLDQFMLDRDALIKAEHVHEAEWLQYALVVLRALEVEMSYLFSSRQELLRARSEVALSHLKRLLVVDQELREKWRKAFNAHETQCERLGAVHLLWHGIYALKINAEGARTDLVYPERMIGDVTAATGGLVLTEWKKGDQSNYVEQFKIARNQAKRYCEGPLAGLELTTHRFAIVVTVEEVPEPADQTIDGVVYRHINIPIGPSTPSKQARKKD